MSHPKATGDRRSVNQKLMSLMRLWYECLKAAEGCYFDPDCRAKADDLRNAHAVSEAWLKHALSDDAGQVYGFTRGKGLPGEMYGPLLAREAAAELDRKQRQALPEPVCVGKATVGRFCCGTHDSEFNPIDELDVRSPLTPSALDEHCRDLLFHRAVIRQLHRDAAGGGLRRRFPGARHLGFHGRAPCRGPPCGLPPLHRPSLALGARAAGGAGCVGRCDRGRGRVATAGTDPAGRGGTAHFSVPSGPLQGGMPGPRGLAPLGRRQAGCRPGPVLQHHHR